MPRTIFHFSQWRENFLMHVMLGQGGKRKKDTKKKEKSRKKKRKQKKQQRVSSNDTPQLEEQQQHDYAHVVYVCTCARGRTTARKTDGERARAQRGAVCDERVQPVQLAERWGEELRERPRGLAEGEPGGRAVISSDDSSGTSPRAFLERILSPRTAFSCQCRRDASHSHSASQSIG